MIPPNIRLNAMLLGIHLATLLLLVGCEGCGGETKPVRHSEKQGSRNCRVTVYAPNYGPNDARPSVDVYWDGQKLFSGQMPLGDSGPTGMPSVLIEIQTNPGAHVLKVVHGGASQQRDIRLNEVENRHYKLLVSEDGKEILIEDLGNNPKFL